MVFGKKHFLLILEKLICLLTSNNIPMKMRYRVVPDPETGLFKAEIHDPQEISLTDLLLSTDMPDALVKKDEYEKIFNDFFNIIHENALNGIGFTSDFIEVIPTQSDDPEAPPYEVIPGTKLQQGFDKAMENVEMVKVEGDIPTPVQIDSFHDLLSDQKDEVITPGGMAEIEGDYLKIIHPDAAEEGVFFTNTQTQEVFKSCEYLINAPFKLTFNLPEVMPAGEYALEIKTAYQQTDILRSGAFHKLLKVG